VTGAGLEGGQFWALRELWESQFRMRRDLRRRRLDRGSKSRCNPAARLRRPGFAAAFSPRLCRWCAASGPILKRAQVKAH
jgi:hypothetical protein